MPIHFAAKPGLVAYLTAGDPDLKTTRAIAIAAIDAGADVIELGVPFSDPLADGPVIQRASERAVARGTKLSDVLALAKELRAARRDAGLVIFSYLNPILRFGLERFCAESEATGVDGVLITDMIVEEADEYLPCMERHHLAPIFLAAPTSPDARLERIAAVSNGFVYAISRVGITGTQQSLASDAESLVKRLRRYTDLPIAVGFGVSNAEHFSAVGEFADAAVVGSALVSMIEQSEPSEAPSSIARFIQGLRAPAALQAPLISRSPKSNQTAGAGCAPHRG
ncbi:MAG TPA: tryptophan synthase subunit alpha [Silvibacterium sp.]|nr:tryptophan synthase subunit alpha [Silvibacterium sp.]